MSTKSKAIKAALAEETDTVLEALDAVDWNRWERLSSQVADITEGAFFDYSSKLPDGDKLEKITVSAVSGGALFVFIGRRTTPKGEGWAFYDAVSVSQDLLRAKGLRDVGQRFIRHRKAQ